MRLHDHNDTEDVIVSSLATTKMLLWIWTPSLLRTGAGPVSGSLIILVHAVLLQADEVCVSLNIASMKVWTIPAA